MIEALVALAVLAAGLAAIGGLGFSTIAAAHRAETRLLLAAAARKVFVSLRERGAIGEGQRSGQVDGATWRLQASPYPFAAPGAPGNPAWTLQSLRLVVASPSGGQLVIDTVRLRPTGRAP